MESYALFDLLLRAESETEVDEALKKAGYSADDPNLWQPFGGFGTNLNTINNQQSDATGQAAPRGRSVHRGLDLDNP